MSQRSDGLADRLEQGARALAKFASALSDTEWHSRVLKDGRKVSYHHLAILQGVVRRRLSAARAS